MAYVGDPFTHDIFVTYSHGDPNDTGASKRRRWSQAFARELESELREYPRLARDIRIFLDQHPQPAQGVDPMAGLSDKIRADIEQSAILTVLMSPHYLQSTWCRDEREWWCARQPQLRLPPEGRIAVVRIWPTDATWPDCFVDRLGNPLVGFCFYDKEQARHRPQPYEWPEPDPGCKGAFRAELLRLVSWLDIKLEELRKRLEDERRAAAETARLAAAGGQVVYLHGRTEYADAWERAHKALSDCGLAVMPGDPDPVESDLKRIEEVRNRRIGIMKECDALLLVGTANGRAVDEDIVVVGRHDRHLVLSKWQRRLPCAVLDGAGAIVATANRRNTARNLNVAWIDATQDPWTPAVQQWLQDASRSEAHR